jgi:hypothetical protein
MRVIGYIRVSTDEQASHGVSLAAQEAKVCAYCSLYDLEIVELVNDPGASAKTLDRPGLARVLAALDRGEVDGLVVAILTQSAIILPAAWDEHRDVTQRVFSFVGLIRSRRHLSRGGYDADHGRWEAAQAAA